MDFLQRNPRKELRDYITGFINLEGEAKENESIPLYPNNYSYLTYSYCNSATFLGGDVQHLLPKLFVSGQVMESNLRLQINEKIGHLGVEFKPSGFYKLFQFDMSKLLNTYHPLSKIDKTHGELLEQLEAEHDFQKRCSILEGYLLLRAKTAVKTSRVDHAISLLEQDPGTKIKDLSKAVAVGQRQLRRDFLKVVGVPPKVYARIQQIKKVFLMINPNKKEQLKEYAYKCGYYDVAHFIHSFKNEIDQNPTEFIKGFDDYLSFYLGNKRS